MEPKSLRVIQAVELALSAIDGADYHTDAGNRITRGRRQVGHDDQFPLLIIHEGEEEVVKNAGPCRVQNRLNVTIEGWCETDLLNPLDDAHRLLADIQRAIVPLLESRADPGLIIASRYQGRVIEPPDDGSRLCSLSVLLTIDWSQDLSNPAT